MIFGIYRFVFLFAQQNLGISKSNYADIQSASLNPSSLIDSKLKWDVNLIPISTIFDKDKYHLQIQDKSLFH